MSRLLLDMIDKECSIAILGIYEIKGIIMDVDDKWIKFKYTKKKKERVEMIKISLISGISIL